MAKKNQHQSSMGTVGSVAIGAGIFVAFGNLYIGSSIIGFGIFLLIIAVIVDRLDIIIDLLRQVIEHQPDTEEEKKARLEEE